MDGTGPGGREGDSFRAPLASARKREGGLDAPTRHQIAWQDPDFADRGKTEAEMRRIFEICHLQGMELLAKGDALPERALHPIELVARAYGIAGTGAKPAMMRTANEPTADARPPT